MKAAVLHCAVLAVAIAATHVLTGCASVQETPDVPAPGAAGTSGSDPVAELTGSRIPARRSEKMVSQIGAKDYRENRDALPAPFRVE